MRNRDVDYLGLLRRECDKYLFCRDIRWINEVENVDDGEIHGWLAVTGRRYCAKTCF